MTVGVQVSYTVGERTRQPTLAQGENDENAYRTNNGIGGWWYRGKSDCEYRGAGSGSARNSGAVVGVMTMKRLAQFIKHWRQEHYRQRQIAPSLSGL